MTRRPSSRGELLTFLALCLAAWLMPIAAILVLKAAIVLLLLRLWWGPLSQ